MAGQRDRFKSFASDVVQKRNVKTEEVVLPIHERENNRENEDKVGQGEVIEL